MSKRLNVLIAASVAFFASTSMSVAGNEKMAAPPVEEIVDVIARSSLYILEENEVRALEACMKKRAQAGLRVIGGRKPGGCFSRDKAAHYITKEEYAARMAEMQDGGRWSGVGLEFELAPDKKTLIVSGLVDGSAAEKSGRVVRGDRIVGIGKGDGEILPLEGRTFDGMLELIDGTEGAITKFAVVRKNATEVIAITSESLNDGVVVKEVAPGVAYLKLTAFWPEDVVKEEVEHRLITLAQNGVRSLVIDLRGNYGGSMEAAAHLLALFAPEDHTVLVVARFRDPSVGYHFQELQPFATTHRGKWADWKIAVLVDENSASASEIVARSLKRWGALVVGARTMGKESIQPPPFLLSNGGALILTVGDYYIPGLDPAQNGVVPHVKAKVHCAAAQEKEDTKKAEVCTDHPLKEALKRLQRTSTPKAAAK